MNLLFFCSLIEKTPRKTKPPIHAYPPALHNTKLNSDRRKGKTDVGGLKDNAGWWADRRERGVSQSRALESITLQSKVVDLQKLFECSTASTVKVPYAARYAVNHQAGPSTTATVPFIDAIPSTLLSISLSLGWCSLWLLGLGGRSAWLSSRWLGLWWSPEGLCWKSGQPFLAPTEFQPRWKHTKLSLSNCMIKVESL